jgi:hypothetical protein
VIATTDLLLTMSSNLNALTLAGPRPASARDGGGPFGHPAGVSEGSPKQQLDVGVEAAEFVRCPPRQRVVYSRIDAEQDRLPVSVHE